VNEYPYEARRRVDALISSTKTLIRRDPEQEVQGEGLAVAAAAISAVKAALPDDVVVDATQYLLSAERIGRGEAVRAADLLVVAEQLSAAIGPLPEPPWTPEIRHLLKDWAHRADESSKNHFARSIHLSALNMGLGIPVVVLTTVVGTSVFATLQQSLNTTLRVTGGILIVIAAVLAALETWLRLGEGVEKNRAAAEMWSAIRREITEMVALPPPVARGGQRGYLDNVRKRMDEIAEESPEMRNTHWGAAPRTRWWHLLRRKSP
jgi:hypothetical protein